MTGLMDSPIGLLAIDTDGNYITAIRVTKDRPGMIYDAPTIQTAKEWLESYFRGSAPSPSDLPLRPAGTPFQRTVWSLLLQIPYGESISYGALAQRTARLLGKERMSAQAIGGAVGRNPILIMIPCHRVLGADGSLTGFSDGIDKKIILLEHEHIQYRK